MLVYQRVRQPTSTMDQRYFDVRRGVLRCFGISDRPPDSGALLEQSLSSWETGSVGFIFLWNRHLDWDWCYFFDWFHQSFIWFQQWQASYPRIFVLLACWQSQTWDSTEHVPVGESAIPQYLCAPQICLTGYIHVSRSGVLPIRYSHGPYSDCFPKCCTRYEHIITYFCVISLVTVHFFLRCLGFAMLGTAGGAAEKGQGAPAGAVQQGWKLQSPSMLWRITSLW
jgi:hypothetical protein